MRTKRIRSPFNSVNIRPLSTRVTLPVVNFNWPVILTGVGLFAVFLTVLALIQFSSPNLVSNDDYFHIKFAQVMRRQGLTPPFIWLPLTILNEEAYFDHHFLFHVLMLPFTFGDLREGAKWVGVIFPSVTFLVGWIFLRRVGVPYAWLWALGFLAMSEIFLFRLGMARVQAASLLMLFLTLLATLTRHYRWLLPLGFVYVWLYDGFPFMLALVGIYVMMHWLLDQKFDLRPLLYAGLGVGLGLLINPYFPNNVIFIYHHFLPKITNDTTVKVGNEWNPYRTWTLIQNSAPALFAFVAGTFALGLKQRRMSSRTATLWATAILFGFLLFKSRRFVEYFPAFALLFCAIAWSPVVKQLRQSRRWAGIVFPVGLALILIPTVWFNVQTVRDRMQDTKPYQRYAVAAAWLEKNTPAGSRVFQTDWDDFTRLFFYNTQNTYTVGLDPTYMQLDKPKLYALWRAITKGQLKRPGQTIVESFGANVVITDLDHESFIKEALADPSMTALYRDEYAAIFLVSDQAE